MSKFTSIKKGVASFMYEGETKESALARIDSKEQAAIQKAQERAEKKRVNLENKAQRKEQKALEREARRKERADKIFFNEATEMDLEEGYESFWSIKNEDRAFYCRMLSAEEVLGQDFKPYSKDSLRGQDLLKRNLKTSPLFVEYEDNILKVISVEEVERESSSNDTAYVMLETTYDCFVLEFKYIRQF